MSLEVNQDETIDFVCESEDVIEVEAPAQEVEVKEEQASSETTNTEDDASKEVEAKAETKDESTDKKEADSSGTDTAAEHDKEKKPNRAQKRINEVVRQREDEKRKNETLEARIKELEGNKEAKDNGKTNEPVESDFDTYDDYLDALDKHDNSSQKGESEAAPDKKDTESKADNELTDSQRTALVIMQERVASADKPEDFEAVALNPDIPVTGEMLEALSECDDPVKVMYHLGQNKDLAAEIAGKSPVQQMREIAKIDLSTVSKPAKPTKTTNAPDAIDPVSGTDSQKKSHSEMSFSEFEAEDRVRNTQRKSTW